jgi:hypothetical protein
VVGLAAFCDCKLWYSNCYKIVVYHIFGLPSDIEMFKYLYGIIDDALDTETERFKKTDLYITGMSPQGFKVPRRTLSNSFQKGMVSKIYHRLLKMREERTQQEEIIAPMQSPIHEPQPILSSGVNLIALKHNKLEEEFSQLGMKLRKAPSTNYCANHTAYSSGQVAGEKVNLRRPIGGKVMGLLQ